MYVPVGQRGQGSGPGIAQQQVVAQQGGGMAAAIRAADASLQAKKKEAQRQYENAQTMMRADLNAIATFDVTKAGPDKAKALTAMANDISEQIKEMNNPVEARALIAKFSQYYNSGVAREALKDEASEDARGRIGADGKTLEGLNSGLPVGMEYDDVDASWLANADAAWNKEYVYQGGEIYVKGPDGSLVKEDEADFLQDTSMYQVGTHSVDVGSLGDWAQSDATKTAIGFKNGTWDETRARGYYRDNVLLEEKAGKEHRLQLLTTMEDRGLTAHLTEEEKQQFRDGIGLESEKFSEIIQKGEDEFVERSQFDGVIGGGKGTSGKSGTTGQDDNITVLGLNVPPTETQTLLKDLEYGDRAGHSINRFNKMPSLAGAYEVPGMPNTDKIDIVGAGINSKGQRVAYIRGYEEVTTDTGIPGFEDTDRKKFYKEIVIGGDEMGVGSDVYMEIYQNHPKMANLIESQLLDYEENKLKRPRPAQQEGQTQDDSLPTSEDRASRNEARLEARQAAVDEARELIEEGRRLGPAHMAYLENNRLGELRGGQFGDYLNEVFPQSSTDQPTDPELVGLARAAGQVPTREEARARQREQAAGLAQSLGDAFLDNPIGRLLGYRGADQRAEDEERREDVRSRGKVVRVPSERLSQVRESVSPTVRNRVDAALERVAEQGLTREVGGGVSARIDDNMIVITDSRDVPIPGIDPIPMTSNLAQTATEAIFDDEGYSASGTLVNVPSSTNSGVTIGGLDLGNKAGDIDRKLEILSAYIPEPQIEALRDISGLTGTEASNALANAISDGRIKPDSWGLTDNSFKDMQARYLDERIIPDVVEKVSKFSPTVDQEDLEELPPQVIQAIASMEFVTPGVGRESSALTAVGKAIESGRREDWLAAARSYDLYYGSLQMQQDSLDAGRILPGNVKRAQRAAELIRSVYS